jgi:hypothetical protein
MSPVIQELSTPFNRRILEYPVNAYKNMLGNGSAAQHREDKIDFQLDP